MCCAAIKPGLPDPQQPHPAAVIANAPNAGWLSSIPVGHWLMIPVLLLAAFLRTQQLASVGVSFDESFCQRMVEFRWSELCDRLGQDTHPPLFYVILKIWVRLFGNGVVAGRLLAALWGLASIQGIYLFARTAYRRDEFSARENFREADLPAVIAATLLAMAPLQIFWTLQIRMYSMSMAMTLWSSYFLVRALRRNTTGIGDWSAYTATAVLLAYSHNFGLFVLVAQYVYASGYRWYCGTGSLFDRLSPIVVSGCCLCLAWQPWLPYFLEQRNRVIHEFYLPQASWELLGTTMHELWAGVAVPHSSTIGLVIAQASLIALLILIVGRRPADYLVALSAAIPVAAAFLISWVSQPIVTARYFMFSQVFLMIAIAQLACRVPGYGRYVVISVMVMGLCGPCQSHYWWREGNAKLPGTRAAVARLDAARGQDPLIVCNPMFYTSVLTYIHDRTEVYNFRPPHGFPLYQGTPVMREGDYVDSEWIRTTRHDYIWTLDTDESYGRVPVPSDWKLLGEERYQEWVAGLTVRLYSRTATTRQ